MRAAFNRWRTLAALLLVPLVPAAVTGWLHPRRPDWRAAGDPIEQVNVSAVPAAVLWVDAREAAEFEAGHIPDAVHVSETNWEDGLVALLDVWHPDVPVVVYCGGAGCEASRTVAERLRREVGIDNVSVLQGGWPAWAEARRETEGAR